jgi:ABC-type uncharacterized transport system involved in gliding motility auxiliary subunit
MNNRMLTVGGLLVAAVLFVAVNIVSDKALRSSRLDLTQARLFTLSEGTRQILRELDEPVTLRFYLSRSLATRLPGINSYASRVEELLEAYARESNGNITLVRVDPEPFSDEEDRAVAYGLRGIPVDEEDATLYFGVVASGSTDQEDAIPFFSSSREKFLEYDLTRLLYTVVNPEQPTIGLLTTLPINGPSQMEMMRGARQAPWMVMEQVGQVFNVMPLEPAIREVPEEVDVLMLVHPKSLPAPARYAVDQFVMGGGRALVFVDPNSEADPGMAPGMMGMQMPNPNRASNPADLLKSWGLTMPAEEVVGDLSRATRVRVNQDGRLATIDYPMWINLEASSLNDADIVTANLGAVTIASPGHLQAVEGSGLTVLPLIESSENARTYPVAAVRDLSKPQDLLRDYKPAGKRFVLAARVTGKAKSAFPDGAPPVEKKKPEGAAAAMAPMKDKDTEAPTKPHIKESSGDINVIVVADADLLADQFWVQVQDLMGNRIAVPTAANGPMVINALDNLTGSSALIEVRSRGSFLKPFTVVDDLRRDAEVKFRQKEQELMARLQEADTRLQALESKKQGEESAVLSDAQRAEIVNFRVRFAVSCAPTSRISSRR